MANDQPTEIFNLCVGVLAVMTTVTSCILFCRVLLPGTQIHVFSEIMAQSKTILLQADAEGLIQHGYRERFSAKINKLEEEGRSLHHRMCEAKTVWEEYFTLFTKLQRDARKLVGRARYVRAWIASHTAQEKQKQAQRREALARLDRESIMQPADPGSIENHIGSPTATMVGDLESTPVVEVLPEPIPPASHECQCAACPVHPNEKARLEAYSYIPIWKWLWRPFVKPNLETSPGCQV